jgi:DHA2 family multidrug resistance protein-like MFS transporter
VALHYGGAATTSGWLIAASAIGSIVTATGIGRIYARHSAERLLAVAFCTSALGLGVIAYGAPLWVIALACFAFGLGNGLISPLQKSLLTRRTPANLRGGVISVDRVIQQVAKSLAPSLMGLLLLVARLDVVFWCLAALSAVGMLALIAVALGRARAAAVT